MKETRGLTDINESLDDAVLFFGVNDEVSFILLMKEREKEINSLLDFLRKKIGEVCETEIKEIYLDFINLIGESGNIDIYDRDGDTLLVTAIFYEDNELVELLLTIGADVNKKNIKGNYPIVFVGDKGNIELAQKLLEKGAILEKEVILLGLNYYNATDWVKLYIKYYKSCDDYGKINDTMEIFYICFCDIDKESCDELIRNGVLDHKEIIDYEYKDHKFLVELVSNYSDLSNYILNIIIDKHGIYILEENIFTRKMDEYGTTLNDLAVGKNSELIKNFLHTNI